MSDQTTERCAWRPIATAPQNDFVYVRAPGLKDCVSTWGGRSRMFLSMVGSIWTLMTRRTSAFFILNQQNGSRYRSIPRHEWKQRSFRPDDEP